MTRWLALLCGVLLTHEAQAKIHATYDPNHRTSPKAKVLNLLNSTEIPALKKIKPADRQQTLCLALGLYHEARSEPQDGQRAVGHVILNRARETGQTICQTVYARGQFAPTLGNTPSEIESWKAVQQQAIELRTDPGWDNSQGATMFYNYKLAHPKWAKVGVITAQYGYHIFVRP